MTTTAATTATTVRSWGRTVRSVCEVVRLPGRDAPLPPSSAMLPFGNGRSYGDSCLNTRGTLLSTQCLDHFIGFDASTGVLRCEAGVQLADILRLAVPRGWFLPVSPGTQFITVGGAIANDVHGKNHHSAGTFGAHVLRLMLRRSDGGALLCAPDENAEWFRATIGGLGLTGLVTWAEIQLRRIPGPWMAVETRPFDDLDGFFACSAASRREYSVAWLDCAARGARLGRGLFTQADHADCAPPGPLPEPGRARTFPVTPPVSLVNTLSVKAFNRLYFARGRRNTQPRAEHCTRFFYPLDNLRHWNRMYGARGFYQYQCVVPADGDATGARDAIAEMVCQIAGSGMGSFLAVLKTFGVRASPGMLSFPCAGATLALDFPEGGARLQALFARLDAVVMAAGGRLYPAKDARMPGRVFRAGYPAWESFSAYVDPAFSSDFWRRVTQDA